MTRIDGHRPRTFAGLMNSFGGRRGPCNADGQAVYAEFASTHRPRWAQGAAALAMWVGLALFIIPATASATSPWTPPEQTLDASAAFVVETFDEIFAPTELAKFPPGSLAQATGTLFFDYGLFDNIALDLSLGYTMTSGTGIPGEHGLNDTYMGVRWRFVDEFESDRRWMPTLTLRAGAIIQGSYDTGVFPANPGDGASGGEVHLAAGKVLAHGFAVMAQAGFRGRANDVPADWQLRGEVQKSFGDWMSVAIAYDHISAISGLDLGPGFDPTRAPELKERMGNLEVGVGFEDRWGHVYDLFYARTVWGRNTGAKNIFGAAITFPFTFGR